MEPIRVPPTPAVRRWSREHGFSPELVARWATFYPDVVQLLAALERPAPTYLRLNPLRGRPDETVARLREKGFGLEPSGLPLTWRVGEQPFSIGATEEYLLGRYFLQDASSGLAPLALEPRPGEAVADLCAAPGGKTVEIAGLVRDAAALFAFEIDPRRTQALVSNLHRCGVAGAAVYGAPASAALGLGLSFDRILLDAPCTGEGVIPRDPSRRRGHLLEYAACAQTQRELLETAHRLLRPGGVLVYSTCTLAPEENELQLHDFIARHEDVQIEPLPPAVRTARLGGAGLLPGLTEVAGKSLDARLRHAAHALPHPHGCLGFFLARLRKGSAA